MIISPVPDDRTVDQEIRDLLQGLVPAASASRRRKRETWHEIERRFGQRRARSRRALSAGTTVVVVLLLSVTQLTDVGSDGFDLLPTGEKIRGQDIVETPFSGYRLNLPDSTRPIEEQVSLIEGAFAEIQAQGGHLYEIEGWSLGSQTRYNAHVEIEVDGEIQYWSKTLTTHSSRFRRTFVAFFRRHNDEMMAAIDNGLAADAGTETLELYGRKVSFRKWTYAFPEYGTVVYWKGVPVEN